jgi:TetR/AcrR family transcriptional regulator, repressor of fatR-cypB operon
MARVRDEQKIEIIYQSALKLVLKEGFSGLKMSQVAKEAGVATGTVYIYFKDKDDLINSLYLHLKRSTSKRFLSGYHESESFMQGFQVLWNNYLDNALKFKEESAFLEQYYRSPFLKNDVKMQSREILDPIYQLIERGKTELLIKEAPADFLLAQLIGPIHELVKLLNESGEKLEDSMRNLFQQMAWDSIKK